MRLAVCLDLSSSAVSTWRLEDRLEPVCKLCIDIAISRGVSLDWLVFGKGERQMADMAWTDQPNERLARLIAFLEHFSVTRSEDGLTWLEVQLARAGPEYMDWVESPKR